MLLFLLLTALQSGMAHWADSVGAVHDALHYDITVIPSDTGTHVLGEVQITWRLRSSAPVTMQLDSSMRVIRVLVDGRPNTRIARTMYGRSEGYIAVPHAKRAGDTISTRVRYRGFPRDGLIIGQNQYGERAVFADNWPNRAHLWFPSHDVPVDKASVAFHVQAPTDEQVIANGLLEKIDTLPYGHRVWHYRLEDPIPVYTMVLGMGRFARTRLPDADCKTKCVPVTVWTYPRDSAFAVTGPFRRASEILDYFAGTIAPFPYSSLAHVESKTRFGGMENASAIFYDEKRYASKTLSEVTVAHEIAHQWFGDAVTEAAWPHLWLSEGFATYLSALWVGHTLGDSVFRATMRATADTVFQSSVIDRPIVDSAATDPMALLNANNYQKGAWILHQLRGLVGDSAFFAGLRRYYREHQDSTALSSDFARIMSETAGRDLEWYFRQSLMQPGYPILDLKWKHGGKKLTLDLLQIQKPEWGTYRMPKLELLVDGKSVLIDVDGRQSRKVVDGIGRSPNRIEVDPHGRWLLQVNSVSGER
jgi:aminopeptidase N